MKKLLLIILGCVVLSSCGSSKSKISSSKYQSKYDRSITKDDYHGLKSGEKHSVKSSKHSPSLKKIKENEADIDEVDLFVADKIIDYAKSYMGTKYKYGGMNNKGIDCSGLIYQSFLNAGDIFLPRSSREIAHQGEKIRLNQVRKGDLVFFKTSSRNVINHVGLVVENNHGNVQFIHSSTSKGVIISNLKEDYWNRTFVEARRLL